MNGFERPFTFDRVIRLLIVLLVTVGLFVLINAISGALLPFLIAWLLAYLINPLVEFFQKKLKIRNRVLSIVFALLSIGVFVTGVIMLLIPSVSIELEKFSELVSKYSESSSNIPFIPQSWVDFISSNIDFNHILKYLNKEDIVMIANKILPGMMTFFSNSINIVIGVVASSIVFLYLIFILLDYDKLSDSFIKLIAPKYRANVTSVANDVKDSMNRYFRGQALVALCVGILFAIGFKIIGLPLAIALGLFVGLLNMVPYLQIVGFLPTILLCFLQSAESGGNFWIILLLATSVFVVVQIIQDTIIVPKIMGKITGLNPAVILLSLSIWGSLMGIIGMIIALPMTTLLISYYQRFVIGDEKIYKEKESKEDNLP